MHARARAFRAVVLVRPSRPRAGRARSARAGLLERLRGRDGRDDKRNGAVASDVAALERAVALESRATPLRVEDGSRTTTRRAVMAGNWKLNPRTREEATTLARLTGAAKRESGDDVDVFVCPPAVFLGDVARAVRVRW